MDILPRSRDLIVIVKGTANPVMVDARMQANGWAGGQGCTWVDSPNDEFLCSYSDGTYGGFLLWGSNETADQFTSMTGNQPKYGFAVMCSGTWIVSTGTYEKYTYLSRTGGGPLVPLNQYTFGRRLVFSLRGLLTYEDEWTLSGDPRRPNNYYVAYVVQPPSATNNNFLMVQTSI